jgi:anti-sigma factor (TIGR02949 family)
MKKSDHKNISCEEALKRVFDYIDNNLNDTSKGEFEQHVERCRHCFDRVEFEKLLKSRLRALKHKESSEGLRKRVDDIITKLVT